MKTLLVNLFAGPGAGKSTLCAGLFANLKMRGVSCEMAREYTKDFAWRGVPVPPQESVWDAQRNIQDRYMGKVDVVVTDSPTALSAVYANNLAATDYFRWQVIGHHVATRPRLDVLVTRVKPYVAAGRYQTEDEARDLDARVADVIGDFDLVVTGDGYGLETLTEETLYALKEMRSCTTC